MDCPHLLVKATDSPLYMSEDVAERILRAYVSNNPDFEYRTVVGGHHAHMNHPEEVAPIINKFLGKKFMNKGTEEKESMPFNF